MGNCFGKQSSAERRQNNWKATGIVSLRDAGIRTLPTSVVDISSSVKVLDAAGNSIAALPDAELPYFVQLQRFVLSNNALAHLGPGIGGLHALKYLALDSNRCEQALLSHGNHTMYTPCMEILAIPHQTWMLYLLAFPANVWGLVHAFPACCSAQAVSSTA